MKLVDVTLRDGGFINDFNWNLEKAKLHADTMAAIGVHVVELGYWKQTEKSSNPFYNMDEQVLSYLSQNLPSNIIVAVMIDFSYCSRNIDDYPKNGQSRLDLIRITSRKSDMNEALAFATKLKKSTGCNISFQVINCTNYSKSELTNIAKKIVDADLNIAAFADSHGNLNLYKEFDKYRPAIEIFKEYNLEWGFHLHNHTGRASLNYWMLQNEGCNYMDGSVNGLGKGNGNLKLEEIVTNENIPKMLDYMVNLSSEEMRLKAAVAYNIICGRSNVTDNYRKKGLQHEVAFLDFQAILKKLESNDRDEYNPSQFDFWLDNLVK
jgi:4-hydroxy 2-oxovalerate aldolase